MRALALSLQIPAALIAQDKASAEVKVGLKVDQMTIQGESGNFSIPAGTRIFMWTKVSGSAESSVQAVFEKGGKEVFKQELKVPRSPYRTHAYRTFRTGDGGAWTVKVVGANGEVLGKAEFTVEVK